MMGTILNWRDAMGRVVNNRGLYVKLLGRFVESQANVPAAIGAALEAGNQEEARHLTHTLKGAAANLGAEVLAEAAMRLEETILGGSHAAGHLGAVSQAFEDTVKAMDEFRTA